MIEQHPMPNGRCVASIKMNSGILRVRFGLGAFHTAECVLSSCSVLPSVNLNMLFSVRKTSYRNTQVGLDYFERGNFI